MIALTNLEPIAWLNDYNTGVDEIDRQHRMLFDIINRMRLEHADPDTSHTALGYQLTELVEYTLFHFASEERLMRQSDLANVDADKHRQHIEAHRAFTERILGEQRNFQHLHRIDTRNLLIFLSDWLVQHILNSDQQLGVFLRQSEAGVPVTRLA